MYVSSSSSSFTFFKKAHFLSRIEEWSFFVWNKWYCNQTVLNPHHHIRKKPICVVSLQLKHTTQLISTWCPQNWQLWKWMQPPHHPRGCHVLRFSLSLWCFPQTQIPLLTFYKNIIGYYNKKYGCISLTLRLPTNPLPACLPARPSMWDSLV